MRSDRPSSSDAGFSLVEVLVAATVLLAALGGVLTTVAGADRVTADNQAREGAVALQRELTEAVHQIPFDQFAQGSIVPRLQAQGALGDSQQSAAGWTVRRRGITYSLSVGACAVDDPRDGNGYHDAGTFCAGGAGSVTADQCAALLDAAGRPPANTSASATTGDCGVDLDLDGSVDGLNSTAAQACSSSCTDTNPVDYERIVSLVSWEGTAGHRWSLQGATLPNPGLAAAPAILTFSPTISATVTSSAITSVTVNTTLSLAPASFAWYVDGSVQGTSPGTATTWSFTWPLGTVSGTTTPGASEVLDGSYLLGARAFDQFGQAGQLRTVTISLNRRAPYPPANLAAGRSGSVVELEWSPSRERDVIGYKALRLDGTTWTTVCSLTQQTSCRDSSPPIGVPVYAVVAVDRDATGAARDGDRSTSVAAVADLAPGTPTGLSAVTSGDNVVLSWTAPVLGVVDHYEIYRDGNTFADRYDRTLNATTVTYTDKRTGGVAHGYRIAAVSPGLARSALTAEVVR